MIKSPINIAISRKSGLVTKMKSIKKLSVNYIIILVIGIASGQLVDVEIDDGPIQGTTLTSRLERQFYAFRGIPFAQPPVGNLRYRAPVRVNPWTETLPATEYGPMCYQVARIDSGIPMSENCLQINVFSPNLAASLPVIVYVFGGGFVYGSGIDQGRPENLMDRDVVVVNFNYRLGALGFLALETSEIPGNAAMKDQILALQWVQRNIARFGGDPNSVTIAGLSAGGISVTGHMLSPMAVGLFHKVISISGAISSRRSRSTGLEAGRRLAESLNCTETDDIEDMVTCLQERSPDDIIRASLNNPPCTGSPWVPVVEPDLGQIRYLEDDPDTLLLNGNFTRVPVLIGITADEFAENVPGFLNSPRLQELNENFYDAAPCIFNYEQNTERSRAFSDLLKQTLLPLHPIDVRSFDALKKIFSDGLGYSTHRFVHHITNFTDVFYYKFSYVGTRSLFPYPGNNPFGVNHGDDLQYPFNAGPSLFPENATEHFMVERMTKIYESFASTGDPNYDSTEMNWPRHNVSHEFYMDIGFHMIEKNGLFLDRYAIWDRYNTSSTITIGLQKMLLLLVATLVLINKQLF